LSKAAALASDYKARREGRQVPNPEDDPSLPHFPEGSDFARLESRRHQIFATLSEDDLRRVDRFGAHRSYQEGELLFEAGKPSPGMFVVLSGRVALSRPDPMGQHIPLGERGRGHFLAELGTLSAPKTR
jgi:thioredoxin reductase (NADPH)